MNAICRSLLSLPVCLTLLHADQPKWNKVSDGQLELYTVDDPAKAAVVLASFNRLRSFFGQSAPFPYSDRSRLQIVAFQSEKEYAPYRLNAGSVAFYEQTPKGEYVVLQDLSPEHHGVSAHEFTHFVVGHSGLRLPLWLNEGVADFYSTVEISDDQAVLGKPIPGRLHLLHKNAWLPLASLFAVDTSSEYYADPVKMALFYSESWAFTHMLAMSPEYSAHFPAFLRSISDGHSAAQTLQTIYSKTLTEVDADLHVYVDQPHLPLANLPFKLGQPAEASPRVTAASRTDVDVVLADLSLSNPDSKADIQARLVTAAGHDPQDAHAEEALGFLALHQGKIADARAHLHKAIDRHSTDPAVYFYAAHYDREAGVADEQALPLLRQALERKPDYYEARLELAMAAASTHDYALALDSLAKIPTPRPENAYTVAYSLAYCYAQTDKFPQARQYLAQAKLLAKREDDKTELATLQTFVDEQQQLASEGVAVVASPARP